VANHQKQHEDLPPMAAKKHKRFIYPTAEPSGYTDGAATRRRHIIFLLYMVIGNE
jgi:hypothetical protein